MNLDLYTTPATVQAIYDYYKASRKDAHRPHLGGSQIGNECSRALWYQFRWMDAQIFEGRTLRLFETGDREEGRIVSNLRAVGVTVWDRDPDTGKQIRFTECDGHFALSLDGVGKGFVESSQPHTLEFKTMNDKNFRAMQKDGLEKSKPIYWAQCQIGMHLADLDRCAFIAVNKNTDEIYMERVKRDLTAGLHLVAKAEAIIFTDKPPAKISNDPSFFGCKFCDYKDVCHNGKPPLVNCRTCAHATPERGGDGKWSCSAGKAFGTVCNSHLFNPYAMPWEIADAGDDWIEYDTRDGEVIRNHEGNSADIASAWVPF
jgi:hypothetical protein